MYPNPASGYVTVESKRNIAKPIHYQLFDVAGKLLRQGFSIEDKFQVSLEGLSAGLYIIQLFNGDDISISTNKIIVK